MLLPMGNQLIITEKIGTTKSRRTEYQSGSEASKKTRHHGITRNKVIGAESELFIIRRFLLALPDLSLFITDLLKLFACLYETFSPTLTREVTILICLNSLSQQLTLPFFGFNKLLLSAIYHQNLIRYLHKGYFCS